MARRPGRAPPNSGGVSNAYATGSIVTAKI